MPKKEYRQTDYAKEAKKRYDEKIIRVQFSLSIDESNQATHYFGNKAKINAIAKRLLLDEIEHRMLGERKKKHWSVDESFRIEELKELLNESSATVEANELKDELWKLLGID